jgi:NAD-dependent dihydropyrimidine dehydrogenase PreA subunit
VIELIDEDTCTRCGKCVEICPTDVFEHGRDGLPVIARQPDCTSCMNCELYCPTDSIYVSPLREPEVDLDRAAIIASAVMGSYRKLMNWENGEPPSGTGDNWGLQLREHQGDRPPPASDPIRSTLHSVRDRNLI